ncbi:MAG: TonB-dependent receptor, partial [Hyphomicrobiales bacterium]
TKQDAFRAKLSFDLSETFNVELGYNYTRAEDGRGVQFSVIENVERFFLQNGGATRPMELGETANDPVPGTDNQPTVAARQNEFYMKLRLDTGIGEIRSVTGYAENKIDTNFDFDGSYIPAVYGVNGINDEILQQSVDWNIDAISNVDLTIGGQYIQLKTDTFYDSWAGGPYLSRPYDPTQTPTLASQAITSRTESYRTKEAWAAFIDATVNFGPAALTLGGRYSQETQDMAAYKFGFGGIGGPVVYSPATGADKSSKYKKFTPRATIRFELAPRTSVYASYTKGFRSGEWNGNIPNDNPVNWKDVKPETIDAFEVGIKGAGSRFSFDAAAFYYDYKNLQVSSVVVNPDNSVTPVLQNAPKAKIKGVEANFTYEVTDNFNIRAGGTYLHARYGKGFIFDGVGVSNDPNYGAATCGNGVAAQQGNCGGVGINANSDPLKTYYNVSGPQDISGLQMARAPDWEAYFSADYTIPIGEGGITLAGNVKYKDDYVVSNPSVWGIGAGVPLDRQREQRFVEDAQVLVNASLTYRDPSDTFYVRVFGTNLTDKRYKMHYNGTTTFGTYAPLAEPRTYGVTL